MGLAASQARFLAITSRKASCEFQSMQLAQQQLSLARDLEAISEDYHQALNKTRLIWDPDGKGTSIYDLSYNIMMQPSELNNYMPFMLGRRDGKIALDSKMAAAAKAAGIPDSGFGGNTNARLELYSKFIDELQGSRTISSAGEPLIYCPDAGLGGDLYGRESGGYVSITSLTSYIDLLTESANRGLYSEDSSNYKKAKALTFYFSEVKLAGGWNSTKDSNGDKIPGFKDGNSVGMIVNGDYTRTSYNMADLLNEDITLLVKGQGNYNNIMDSLRTVMKNGSDNGTFDSLINNDVKTWYDALNGGGSFDKLSESETAVLTFVDNLAKGMFALLMPDNPNDNDLNAFYIAMDDVINRLGNRSDVNDYANLGGKDFDESNSKTAVREAENYNCWVRKGQCWALSLSNLTEAFLTNFVNGRDGNTGSYNIFKKVSDSYYVTDDPGYLYQINSGEETNTQLYTSEFYSVIFNTICQNGWYEEELVNDKAYLDNAIKNGQLFVVSRGADNYFYQDRYVMIDGGHIMENTDNDAVTRAEREYTSKKAKINIKEEQLDIQAKQLDAEISALSTEYDTVKSLIGKNIEKTFSLFNG